MAFHALVPTVPSVERYFIDDANLPLDVQPISEDIAISSNGRRIAYTTLPANSTES